MGGSSKRQVVAYKYYEDQHIVLALSNFDFISHFWFANKLAWAGKAAGASDSWTEITISNSGLFGGEKREGGVAGKVHIGMGWPDQPILSRLASRLGSALMPAYRGVVSLYFDNFYFGNNPYLKELSVRAQAIHKLSDGTQQWYDDKAEIYNGYGSEQFPFFREQFSEPLASVYSDQTSNDNFDNFSASGGVLTVVGPYPDGGFISRPLPNQALIHRITGDFKMKDATSVDDISNISVRGPGGTIFGITPRRQLATDPQRRCHVNAPYGGTGVILSDSELDDDTWYSFDAQINTSSNTMDVQLYKTAGSVLVGSVSDVVFSGKPTGDSLIISSQGGNAGANHGGSISWRNINVYGAIETGDINPIHFIRECHTDRIWGGRYPESKMGSSYETAADQIYDEGLGVSFLFTEEIRWKEIIEEVARHIDAIPYQDPDTGLMEIKLIRDDYDIESLPVLDPSNSDLEAINEPFDNEIFNTVIIEFLNNQTRERDSVTLSDPAAVDMVGFINSKTFEYSGISNKRAAMLVAERDLARSSKPFYQGRVKTNRSVANLKPGDPFILKSPEDGIEQIVCRVTKRQESGLLNGDIKLEFGEDIFGKVFTSFAEPQPPQWVDPVGDPKQFSYQTAFELPYYLIVQDQGEAATTNLSTDACFYGFAGTEPDVGAHIDYDLYVYPDGTTQPPDIEFALTFAFTPYAIVSSDVDDPNTLIIPVEPLSGMDSVRVGQIILVGNSADDQREAISIAAGVADGDTSITVNRGLIDTTPKPIPAGTPIYFVETFYGASETEYMPSEVVEGYGTPTNGGGIYQGPYTYHDLEMAGRFNKPYPPGDLRLDNLPLPQEYTPSDTSVDISWRHRDRVTQSDQPIHFFDANDYGPEAGTSYRVEADSYDGSGDLISAAWLSTNVGSVKTYTLDLAANPPPAGTVTVGIKVWSVRDGIDSLQAAEAFFTLFLAPENVSAVYQSPQPPSGLAAVEV